MSPYNLTLKITFKTPLNKFQNTFEDASFDLGVFKRVKDINNYIESRPKYFEKEMAQSHSLWANGWDLDSFNYKYSKV